MSKTYKQKYKDLRDVVKRLYLANETQKNNIRERDEQLRSVLTYVISDLVIKGNNDDNITLLQEVRYKLEDN